MPVPLKIRRYQPKDLPQVLQLHVLPMQQVGAYKGDGPWDDDLKRIVEEYCTTEGDFLVGLVDDQIVAMGALRRTGEQRGEIRRVRVHPDFQRRGFGKQIIDRLEDRARQLGYRTVHLQTQAIQTAAREFYRWLGYREARTKVVDDRDYVEFEKTL